MNWAQLYLESGGRGKVLPSKHNHADYVEGNGNYDIVKYLVDSSEGNEDESNEYDGDDDVNSSSGSADDGSKAD